MIKNSEYRYLRRGKVINVLDAADIGLLGSIEQRGPGRKRALLMLHGFGSSPFVYRKLIPTLTGYDAIVCPLLPGHGQTLADFSEVKAQEWVLAAKTQCEDLLKEYKEVDVMGLSMGGLLACYLSQQFTLHHVYLLAPALYLRIPIPLMLSFLKGLRMLGFTYLRNAGGDLMNPDAAELTYRQMPVQSLIEVLSLIQDFEWVTPKGPVDVFLGSHDTVVDSQKVAKFLSKYPNISVHWLNQSAHVLPLDLDLTTISACVNGNIDEKVC
jgi:carboxylesterase